MLAPEVHTHSFSGNNWSSWREESGALLHSRTTVLQPALQLWPGRGELLTPQNNGAPLSTFTQCCVEVQCQACTHILLFTLQKASTQLRSSCSLGTCARSKSTFPAQALPAGYGPAGSTSSIRYVQVKMRCARTTVKNCIDSFPVCHCYAKSRWLWLCSTAD